MRLDGNATTNLHQPWHPQVNQPKSMQRRRFLTIGLGLALGGVAFTTLGFGVSSFLIQPSQLNNSANLTGNKLGNKLGNKSIDSSVLSMMDIPLDSSLHVVLMDCSDPVSANQSKQIDELLRHTFVQSMHKGDRILVVQLTSDQYDPIKIIHYASDPGKGSEANILLETPIMVDNKRNKEFLQGYYDALEQSKMPVTQAKTPLIAGLEILSSHPYFRNTGQSIKRHLLIVSDGLEHAEVSAYSRQTLYKQQGQNYVDQHKAALDGVDVMVALINRPKHKVFQNNRHWQWLEGYLRESGATSVQRYPIV